MKKPTNEQILNIIRKNHPDPEVMGVCEDLLSVTNVLDVTLGDVKDASGFDRELARDVSKALLRAIKEAC